MNHTLVELLEFDVDLVNLDTEVHLEVGQFVHAVFQRTNQLLEFLAKVIGDLRYVKIFNVIWKNVKFMEFCV